MDITPLRFKGRRLKASDLQTPTRGLLSIQYDASSHSSFRRPVLAAYLQIERGNQMMVSVMTPIFDVRILQLSGTELSLSGIELETVKEADDRLLVFEHMQVWRCVYVHDATIPPTRLVPGVGTSSQAGRE